MSINRPSHPTCHDALLSTPNIYVARAYGDEDVIEAEVQGPSYILPPAYRLEPGPQVRQPVSETQRGIVEATPEQPSPEASGFVTSGYPMPYESPKSRRREPNLPDDSPLAGADKIHVLIGFYENKFGLCFFMSTKAWRYFYFALGLVAFLVTNQGSDALEFVLHFIF